MRPTINSMLPSINLCGFFWSQEAYNLWREHERWLAPTDHVNPILAIAGDMRTRNIFMITEPRKEWTSAEELRRECCEAELTKCRSIMSELGMSEISLSRAIVRIGSKVKVHPGHHAGIG